MIPILPTASTDIARLALRMKTLQEKGLTHSLKKASGGGKKRKKHAEANATESTTVREVADTKQQDARTESVAMKPPRTTAAAAAPVTVGIKNASTASLTAKVLGEQEERNKRRRMEKNENLESLFSSRDQTKPVGKSSDFMTRGFSIPAIAKR